MAYFGFESSLESLLGKINGEKQLKQNTSDTKME